MQSVIGGMSTVAEGPLSYRSRSRRSGTPTGSLSVARLALCGGIGYAKLCITPHWRVMSGGHIQVEGKDEINKRLGRSTDDGDAVVMAFWRKPAEAEVWAFWA